MRTKTPFNLFLLALAVVFSGCSKPKEWKVVSPDQKISFKLYEKESQLYYQVLLSESVIIEESPIGIERNDAQFSSNLSFVSVGNQKLIDEKYTLVTGKQLECNNNANELTVTFENDQKAKIELILRAYNDGVAFKYRFPETSAGNYEITKELTGFKIPEDGKAWIQPYDSITKYSPGYERNYTNGSGVGETSPESEGWCFASLFETKNTWILLTEAGLDGTYCASRLDGNATGGLYTVKYPGEKEAMGIGSANPTSNSLPWETPWRVIVVGEKLATIAETTMITGLSKPSEISDISWIKPGLASWSWWADPDSPKNYKSMVAFIDFASEWGIPYFLVDANWNMMEGGGNIDQLIEYATKKNVGIWLWYNSAGPHNTVTEAPRDLMLDADIRKAEFEKLHKMGVKGVKVDFFQSDKQHIIQQYLGILKDAADNQVMVNFHGCTLPRGWQRTWPNLVSMESIVGEECYMFRETYPETTVWHNTIQPFTRNAVGSMDYTPFGLSDKKYPHLTSSANELALTIVFESGVVHLVDFPNVYKAMPDFVQDFTKQLPTVWDETKLVDGYPGKDVVMARRSGEKWFIGGINGEQIDKEMNLSLDFLTEGKTYQVKLITDGADNKSFANNEISVKKGDKLPVKMLPAGGFAARFE
ncbi:MAG: glycoside hydrolase family 97 catalytic domain-containing protein [Bacteroidota bacterium]|nr:glycoside hydrolase family 97 catalytic domain-containing protein [Bacteroidota bacterium]